ncbi:Uu.00g120720.m01.CDS01 [Anthostomella pinea]|uniref:Uu.00g120720.m01.CDS01 n=1 Tax=Anthostomella pinea TaxID=933095 RepID=A0AAI8YEU4_9PEZI|nr:Uu.00g120720.m01.CDS01 [Anthostomella pinea]
MGVGRWEEELELQAQDTGYSDMLEVQLGKERRHYQYPQDANGQAEWSKETEVATHKLPRDDVRVLADLIRRACQYQVSERLDLTGIMDHEWFDGRERFPAGNSTLANDDGGPIAENAGDVGKVAHVAATTAKDSALGQSHTFEGVEAPQV